MPWTREALTVHLYEPLTEQQMADAELAEAIERSEQNSLDFVRRQSKLPTLSI